MSKITLILIAFILVFGNLFAFNPGNKALGLNGTDAFVHVEIGNSEYFNFTLELWIKVQSYDRNVHYISLYQNAYLVLGHWGGYRWIY